MHTHSKQMTKFISQPLRLLIGRKQWNGWMENEENENSFSYLTWNAQLGKTKQKQKPQLTKEIVSFIAIPLNKVEEFIFSWMGDIFGYIHLWIHIDIYVLYSVHRYILPPCAVKVKIWSPLKLCHQEKWSYLPKDDDFYGRRLPCTCMSYGKLDKFYLLSYWQTQILSATKLPSRQESFHFRLFILDDDFPNKIMRFMELSLLYWLSCF